MNFIFLGYSIQEIIVLFAFYSFLGFLLETVFRSIVTRSFIYPGFLYGPYLPLYGFAAIFLVLFLTPFTHDYLILFIASIIFTTIFEYIAGAFLENLMHIRLWDYSDQKFNFKGRISLQYSLAWGALSFLFIYFIHPFFEQNVIKQINENTIAIISYICLVILLVDAFLSINKAIYLRKELSALQLLSAEIGKLGNKTRTAAQDSALFKLTKEYQEKVQKTVKEHKHFLIYTKPHLNVGRFPGVFKNLRTEISKLRNKSKRD